MFFSSLKEYEGMRPGLSRIKAFLKSIGNPQDKMMYIHIAGTNGKGSTASFIAEALLANGYKTALYTSPHLMDITERIKYNGKNIPKKVFKKLALKYIRHAEKFNLTYFEYLTAIAFIYFFEKGTNIAVIETGLGGRFDATNIIKKPLISVITSISLDHQEILGKSIKEIAFEKAGIIKKGAETVCGKLPAAALQVIEQKTKPFVLNKDFKIRNLKYEYGSKAQKFDYFGIKNFKNINISLLGKYQAENAAVALYCIELLSYKGYIFDEKLIRKSFSQTKWPARLDIRRIKEKNIELIIDGSHNEQGINAFLSFWKQSIYAKEKQTFIFAAMREKNYKKIIRKIAPYAKKIILPDFGNERAVKYDLLKAEFELYRIRTLRADSPKKALEMLKKNETAVVLGSLYLAGEILKILK